MIPWEHERALWARGCRQVAGVDEVGRGPLAGPVVTAAVVVPEDGTVRARLAGIVNDSKMLKAQRREEAAALVHEFCAVAVASASVAEIDALNIRGATLLAMHRAVDGLPIRAGAVLVDGRDIIPGVPLPQAAIIKGDGRELAIACASVVAKVARDALMARLGEAYPAYGWARNAGYGTAVHMAALAEHGVTEHHRTSFAPVAERLEKVA